MGSKTKIDWADATWNPVTGCLHGCKYCYARTIAKRFKPKKFPDDFELLIPDGYPDPIYEIDKPYETFVGYKKDVHGFVTARTKKEPYPYVFSPTFHRYLLDKPKHWRKPRNIFVCSMSDLMGDWVPDPWKQDVIAACKAAPQHRYLFLTKNPFGYDIFPTKDRPVEHRFDQGNFWLGCSMTGRDDLSRYYDHYGRYLYAMGGNMLPGKAHRFVSIEPILTDVMELPGYHSRYTALGEAITERWAGCIEWVIIGAETGNRKGKVVPERKWIEKIVDCCDKAGKPVFMKESLRGLMGEDFRQEFPW